MLSRRVTVSLMLVVVISSVIPFAHANTFYNKTLALHGRVSGYTCEYHYEYVYKLGGDVVTGTVTVKSGKIYLFILTQSEFNQFTSGDCNLPTSSELKKLVTTSYSINYNVPDNGNHYFLFYDNFWQDAIITVTLTFWQS